MRCQELGVSNQELGVRSQELPLSGCLCTAWRVGECKSRPSSHYHLLLLRCFGAGAGSGGGIGVGAGSGGVGAGPEFQFSSGTKLELLCCNKPVSWQTSGGLLSPRGLRILGPLELIYLRTLDEGPAYNSQCNAMQCNAMQF